MKTKKIAKLAEVVKFMDEFCGKDLVKDFSPAHNGLQFENSGKVVKIASAVDAGIAEVREAKKMGANLLLTHHGMYWNSPIPAVASNYEKIKTLVDSDIAVYAMHLPLDAHDKIGNNVLIAKALNLKIVDRCFEHEGTKIGVVASLAKGGRNELEKRLKNLFPDTFKAIKFGSENPKKIAICSGSCGDVVGLLPSLNIDTLICGELREHHFSVAQALNLNLYPCGHYATERFGIAALGELVAKKFSLDCDFIEMNNPL